LWRLGHRGMSIAWGPWSETGAAATEDILAHTRDRGLDALSTSEGLRWLEAAFENPATHLVGARIADPEALTGGRGRLLDELRKQEHVRTIAQTAVARKRVRTPDVAPTSAAPAAGARPAARSFLDDFAEAPVDARRSLVLNRVRGRIRRVLGLA